MKDLFPILDEVKKETGTTKRFSDNAVLTALKSKAADQYERLPLPNPRDKSWSKLAEMQLPDITYRLAQEPLITHNQSKISQEKCSGRIEIREDALDFQLDKSAAEAGVILCDLVSASRDHAQLLEKSLAQLAQTKPARIAEFTTALSRHGFLLYVPGGYRSDLPMEIVTSLKNDGLILPILALVILEEGAQIALISRQESAGYEGKAGISLMNWMIQIGDKAELRFLEIQKYGLATWNFIDEQISMGQAAHLERLLIDTGSGVLQRRFSTVMQAADGLANITGIYTPRKGQVFIYDTHQIHNASRTTSDLLFGGVLNDDAYSLWKGNVYVAAGTKGADGFQRNKNLLLSEEAHAESIPGLEINADDVRCSHAVTLSSVDPEQMFFLKSRGIGDKDAEQLIVSGFLESAATRIRDDYLKERIREELN